MAYYIFIFAASFILLSFTLAVHINEKINKKKKGTLQRTGTFFDT